MGRLILRGILGMAVLLLTYWAFGAVRALRGPGWRSTVRWLAAIAVASLLLGWGGR